MDGGLGDGRRNNKKRSSMDYFFLSLLCFSPRYLNGRMGLAVLEQKEPEGRGQSFRHFSLFLFCSLSLRPFTNSPFLSLFLSLFHSREVAGRAIRERHDRRSAVAYSWRGCRWYSSLSHFLFRYSVLGTQHGCYHDLIFVLARAHEGRGPRLKLSASLIREIKKKRRAGDHRALPRGH